MFDLAARAHIAVPGNPRRGMAFVAIGVVAAVTLGDLIACRAMGESKGAT